MTRFGEFVTERVGRDWYTAKRPSPARCAGRPFISPKRWASLEAEWRAMTNWTPQAIVEARRKLGLSVTEFGIMLGYSPPSANRMVRYLECGDKALMGCQQRLLEAYLGGYRPPDWPE